MSRRCSVCDETVVFLALRAALVSQREQLAEHVDRRRSEGADPSGTAEALGAVEEQIDRLEAGCSEIVKSKEG